MGLIAGPGQAHELQGPRQPPEAPPGWNFRSVILDQDLVLTPDDGSAKITQDDQGKSYDRAGGAYSNYRP